MNIKEFIKDTDKRILAEGNRAVLLETVQEFSKPERLAELIDSAMEQTMDNLVEKSYLHPNGFDKLVMISGEHFNLRLHNFHPPQVMKPAESIHNHKWEFASSIVAGGYTAQEFTPHSGDQQKHHYRYTKGEVPTYQGTSNVQLNGEYQVTPGHSYFMDGDTFHSIRRINDEGCITVMMTGFTKETTTSLFTDEEFAPGEGSLHCGSQTYTVDELKETLTRIRNKVTS